MLVGYCRTSTTDQLAGFEDQKKQLVATGCNKIFAEQISSIAKRDQLAAALDFVREGDCLIVTRLDRLARSTKDFLEISEQLNAKGVALKVLDFGGSELDTQSATGKMLLVVTSAISEFERSLLLERQKTGIAKAKAEGRYRGRIPTARRRSAEIIRLKEAGNRPAEIAATTGISRSSVYRILADAG